MKHFNIKNYLLNNELLKEDIGGMANLNPLGKIDSLSNMKGDDTSMPNAWIADIDRYPTYKGWKASWEHPGIIVWSHENLPFNIVATPGWDGPGTPVEVQYIDDDNVISGDTKVLGVIDQDNFKSFQDYLNAVAPYLNAQMKKTNPMMEMGAKEIVEMPGQDNFRRAYGIVDQRSISKFKQAAIEIIQDLDDDGYEPDEQLEFLHELISQLRPGFSFR